MKKIAGKEAIDQDVDDIALDRLSVKHIAAKCNAVKPEVVGNDENRC